MINNINVVIDVKLRDVSSPCFKYNSSRMPTMAALVKFDACKSTAITIATDTYTICKAMLYTLCICSPVNMDHNILSL